MRRKILSIFAAVLILASVLLSGGCSGNMSMVTGAWKMLSTGDETGANQQESGLPFTIIYDVYPDGRICMLFAGSETSFGKYTLDRSTFKFTSDDGTQKASGSYDIKMNDTDPNTGDSIVTALLILDDQPISVKLQKMMDYSGMLKYLKSQTPAPTYAPAPAASPEPTATPAPSAS